MGVGTEVGCSGVQGVSSPRGPSFSSSQPCCRLWARSCSFCSIVFTHTQANDPGVFLPWQFTGVLQHTDTKNSLYHHTLVHVFVT